MLASRISLLSFPNIGTLSYTRVICNYIMTLLTSKTIKLREDFQTWRFLDSW
jgi:hypothetical protein